MNLDRFRDTPAGRVIRAGTGDAAYWAFAPAPLPPPLELDTRLARVLSGADRALGELAGLGRAMPTTHTY
jgi:hypothetical protein